MRRDGREVHWRSPRLHFSGRAVAASVTTAVMDLQRPACREVVFWQGVDWGRSTSYSTVPFADLSPFLHWPNYHSILRAVAIWERDS